MLEIEATTDAFTGFGERIGQIAEKVGGTRVLAEKTGISPSQLYRYIAEKSQPTLDPLAAIARVGNVTVQWLVTGYGPSPASIAEADRQSRKSLSQPRVRQAFFHSAGLERTKHILHHVEIDAKWIQGKGDPDYMVVTEMSGHNMYPTLINGDLMIVDTSRVDPLPGKLFAFGIAESVICRRLDIKPGSYVLMSDDPRHANLEIEVHDFEDVRILGQIIWIFREVR